MNGRIWSFTVLSVSTLTLTLAIVTREMREREFFRHLDAIDIDNFLINQRLVDKYIKCLLKTGKCDPSMKDLRISLPLILEHMCENRCSQKERRNLQKLFVYIRTNRKLEWDRLAKLYDPNGRHKSRVDAFVEGKRLTPPTTAAPRQPVTTAAPRQPVTTAAPSRLPVVTPAALRRQPVVTQLVQRQPPTTQAVPMTTTRRR